MDLLGVIWWGCVAAGFASVAVAVAIPSRRRGALLVASLLFLVAGVLGILSIGIIFFIVAAIVCAVVAVRAARTDGGGRALTAD